MKLLLLGLIITVSMSARAQSEDERAIFYLRDFVNFSYSGPDDHSSLIVKSKKTLQLKAVDSCSPLLVKQYSGLRIVAFLSNFGLTTEMGFYCINN